MSNETTMRRMMRSTIALMVAVAVAVSVWVAVETRGPQEAHAEGSTAPVTDHTVVPTVETTPPVPHGGDAADDAAIWVNPSDPGRSTIIGTDKQGGIAVYDLAGTQLQYRDETARYNNVDLRTDFPLGDKRVALVAASDRAKAYTSDQTQYHRRIALYSVDPATGTLADPVGAIRADFEPYGLCMYRSQTSGKFYVFVTARHPVGDLDGYVEQWELSDDGSGRIDAKRVRFFGVGSQTEGCVADDEVGYLYLAEERGGIWKYPAEPNAMDERLLVDSTGPDGHLVADAEGLTITYGPNGTGHLLASSQGNSSYTVYRREGSNAYLRTFRVEDGIEADGTTDTDGIDASAASLGSSFPSGLFIAQDGHNTTPNGTIENQNYKLIPLQHILNDPPTTTPDNAGPTGEVSINGGAAYTFWPAVELSLSALDNEGGSGVQSMRFSNDGTNWSGWEDYATSRSSWALSSGAGTKTVYAEFRDVAGNVSAKASDTITKYNPPVKKKKKKRRR